MQSVEIVTLVQDNRTQVQGGVSKASAQQLERIIDTLLTDSYRCPGIRSCSTKTSTETIPRCIQIAANAE